MSETKPAPVPPTQEKPAAIDKPVVNENEKPVEEKQKAPEATSVELEKTIVEPPPPLVAPPKNSASPVNTDAMMTLTNALEANIPKAGAIKNPGRFDVLFGRGGGTNFHHGNMTYRKKIKAVQSAYIHARQRSVKTDIISDIIRQVKSDGGKFLKQDDNDKLWYEVDDKEIKKKTSQTLREGAPQWRKTHGEWQRRDDSKNVSTAPSVLVPPSHLVPLPPQQQPPAKKARTNSASGNVAAGMGALELLSAVAAGSSTGDKSKQNGAAAPENPSDATSAAEKKEEKMESKEVGEGAVDEKKEVVKETVTAV